MKTHLRATIILGSGSIILVLSRLFVGKFSAVLLGPGGLGLFGLLQSLVSLATLIAGLGIGTGLVRSGALAIAHGDAMEVAALQRAAWLLIWTAGGITACVLFLAQRSVGHAMLGDAVHSASVMLMAVAVLCALLTGIATGVLNFHQRIGALAWANGVSAVLSGCISIGILWRWRDQGIASAIVAGQLAGTFVLACVVRQQIGPVKMAVPVQETVGAALALLRFGLPYTASTLVGSGVQFILPSMIFHQLGAESVGFYRAATDISLGYLGFLLMAMGQDYYPRLAAVSDRPFDLVRLVNEQLRLVLLLGTPLILAALALSRWLVPIIYSPEFAPTVRILEWQLVGDIAKFASWTLSYVILARSGGRLYFFAESAGGLTLIVASLLLMRRYGLDGLGFATLVTYMIYYMVLWFIVRKEIGLTWTAANKILLAVPLMSALLIRSLPTLGLAGLRLPASLLLACAMTLCNLYLIWSEFGGARYAHAS